MTGMVFIGQETQLTEWYQVSTFFSLSKTKILLEVLK